MKSKIKKEVIIHLELTLEEATWLKALMQNPINVINNEQESIEEEELRSTFFNNLQALFFDESL